MNSHITAGLVAILVAFAIGYGGYSLGQDSVLAEQARTREAINAAYEKARQGTADEISKLRPRVQVINQKVRETVRVEPVYRDCVHAPGVLDNINEALTGTRPAGGGSLPSTDTPK
jgi:hypothetical protein